MMTVLVVPPYIEDDAYPTLGPQVCDFIEDYLVFGPGDLRGQPAVLDDEKRGLVYRMYEVFPRNHPQAGRRRFKRCALSMRKGTAKTEFAAWIAAAELHPEGPVRCDGFDASGNPVGRPVIDPYIPMVAYTEEQTEELAYNALKTILEYSQIAGDFDIGLERIMRRGGDGRAEALASSPNPLDGARTTFQHCDETHRFTLPKHREAHKVMMANIPKRYLADAWTLETTTAPEPGGNSIAESTMQYAESIRDETAKDPTLFFFHRQASEEHDLDTDEGLREAILEASGPAAGWSDIQSIVSLWNDPTTDRSYFQRVWLNQRVKSADRAFDLNRWHQLADREFVVPEGSLITLGFDGSRTRDATAIVATHVETGYMWPLGIWERPYNAEAWEVPRGEVNEVVENAFQKYDVWRMYCDPFEWETIIAEWAGRFGKDKVVEWATNRYRQMVFAVQAFNTAIHAGELSHSGDPHLSRHIGNAHRHYLNITDDQGERLWYIEKERPDALNKIDAAMGAILSWEARQDAVASGAVNQGEPMVYVLG